MWNAEFVLFIRVYATHTPTYRDKNAERARYKQRSMIPKRRRQPNVLTHTYVHAKSFLMQQEIIKCTRDLCNAHWLCIFQLKLRRRTQSTHTVFVLNLWMFTMRKDIRCSGAATCSISRRYTFGVSVTVCSHEKLKHSQVVFGNLSLLPKNTPTRVVRCKTAVAT